MYIKAKSIAHTKIEKNPYPVLSTKTVSGSIYYCGELVISQIQHTLYNTMLHTQLVIWYSTQFSLPNKVLKTKVS